MADQLSPLLDWLHRLGIISYDEKEMYVKQNPRFFFDQLRSGYMLSKIAIVAVPANATHYRNDICHEPVTRYVKKKYFTCTYVEM